MTRVQVLLGTYNGGHFLPHLLESVFNQKNVTMDVLARDEGSSDETWDVLQRYARSHSLHVARGERLRQTGNYFWLLHHASRDVDYIAIADQDDVWLEGKLARATALLAGIDVRTPAMYCSRRTVVAADLRVLGLSQSVPRGPSFENSLVQNIASGPTIVINQAARAVLDRGYPSKAFLYDWWMYQVVAGLGTVVFDQESNILYRQHGGNMVGEDPSILGRFAVSVRRIWRRGFRHYSNEQLAELERIHGPFLSPARRALLRRQVHAARTLPERLRRTRDPGVVFQARWQQLAFRCLILLNRA
jgi:glycosyltransferase involved in cell wall biosynthesis